MRIVVPYTSEVLDSIISQYQESFCFLQFFFLFLAFLLILTLKNQTKSESSFISFILAFFWIWVGLVYFFNHYNTINWIGEYLGYIFAFQGVLLLWFGAVKKSFTFETKTTPLVLLFIILFGVPLGQFVYGIELSKLSIVGMLPNISVVFSLAVFLFLKQKKWVILIIPTFWSFFSFYWNYLLSDFFNLMLCALSIVLIALLWGEYFKMKCKKTF